MQIATQISVLIAKVARVDCPRQWPELIPTLVESVKVQDDLQQHRALLTLYHVTKTLASKRLAADRKLFYDVSNVSKVSKSIQTMYCMCLLLPELSWQGINGMSVDFNVCLWNKSALMLWVSVYYGITGSRFLDEMFEVIINFAYSLNVILICVKKQSFIYRTVSAFQPYDVYDLLF